MAAENQGMAVSVVKAKSACFVDSLQMTGHIEAREESLVRPDVEGMKISKILVEDGATVSSGQALAELTRPDWIATGPAKATVLAPASGLLLRKTLAIGQPASARADPMFRIIKNGDLELVVQVSQQDLGKLKPGETARIQTLDGAEFAGTVRMVDQQIDGLTQASNARLQFRSQPGIKIGMFAKAWIDAARSCGATIPLSSVLYGAKGSMVQVVRNNRVETKLVKIGTVSGEEVQIEDGLGAGELVVARAGGFLREGDPVKPALLEMHR
jgi:multidrug efflux pump subunit AcrA (membrane-fusion protein)